MTDPLHSIHKEGDWVVVVDYQWDFDYIGVDIAQKQGPGRYRHLRPGGDVFTQMGEQTPSGFTFQIDRDCRIALARALLGEAPASQQLVDNLSASLSKETERVDKLLEHLIRETTR